MYEDVGASDLLPKFSIRRIVISDKQAVVSCALRRPRELNYENWIGSNEFNPYIKYYFVAAPRLSGEDVAKFYYPQTRITSLTMAIGSRDISSWDLALGPQEENLNLGYIPTNPFNLKGYTAVTLSEILQGEASSKEPLEESLLQNDEGYNTSFEVVVDLVNNPTGRDVTQLNIMAFAQLDIARLKEDFGLSVTRQLANIGSALIYEQCLIRSRKGSSSTGFLVVPEFRRVFTREDGTLYDGPSHYHGVNNPGPNQYIGWMAGPIGGDMSTRPLLRVREIPNTKVTSNLFIERALNPAGFALSEDNSYSGYGNTAEAEISDPGLALFGETITQTLNSQIGLLTSAGQTPGEMSQEYHKKLKELMTLSLKRGKLTITDASINPEKLSWISTASGTPYHGSLMMLNLGDILTGNSRLGYLMSRHQNINSRESKELVEAMIAGSKIYDFSIFRRRITGSPVGNNALSTAVHETYDNDDPEEYIIRTSAPSGRKPGDSILRSARNDSAQIFEHNPNIRSPQKIIMIHDYDMFATRDQGRYEYVVDLTLEDGIAKHLKNKYQELSKAIKSFSEYVLEASRPYMDYRKSGFYANEQFQDGLKDQKEREGVSEIGNYDHSTGEFTDSFVKRSLNLRQRTDNMVDAYIESYYILTAKSQFNKDQMAQMKSSLLAKNTTLSGIEYFLGLCLKLQDQFETLINPSMRTVEGTLNLGSHKRRVSGEYKHPNNIISLRAAANLIVKAVPKNSLFVRASGMRVSLRDMASRRTDAVNLPSQAPAIKALPPTNFFGMRAKFVASRVGATDGAIAKAEKIYEQETIADITSAKTDMEKALVSSRVTAAIEKSKSGPIVGPNKEDGIKNDLKTFEDLLSKHSGVKFETLVTKAAHTEESTIKNKNKEKDKFISSKLQESIFSSVVKSESASQFVKETEKNYKDLSFKKEALGELYNTVSTILSTDKKIRDVKRKVSYKDKVLTKTDNKKEKAKRKNDLKSKKESIKDNIFKPYTIKAKEGLVPATDAGDFGIIIYQKEGDAFEGAVVTDNVQLIVTEETPDPKPTVKVASKPNERAPARKSAAPPPSKGGGGY